MASPQSAQHPVLRWLMLALFSGAIWLVLAGRFPGMGGGETPKDADARAALKRADIKTARQIFDAEIKADPADPATYVRISTVCRVAAASADPALPASRDQSLELGVQYMRQAVQACRDLPRPIRAVLYNQQSMLYSLLEKTKPQWNAILAAQRAAELDPASAENLNAYGYMLAENDRGLDQAVLSLTTALQIQKKAPETPENRALTAMIEDSYGWALYKQGKYDTAASALNQAITDLPTDEILQNIGGTDALKEIYYHLGATYRKQGDLNSARSALNRALGYDKNYREAQEELKAIDGPSAAMPTAGISGAAGMPPAGAAQKAPAQPEGAGSASDRAKPRAPGVPPTGAPASPPVSAEKPR